MTAILKTQARRPVRFSRERIAVGIGWAAVPVIVLILWQATSRLSNYVPGVIDTFMSLALSFGEATFWVALGNTGWAVFVGFVISCAVGLPFGFGVGASQFWGAVFDPIIDGFFAIPRIIFYPMLLAIFGIGLMPKIVLVIISAFFPIVISTSSAVRDINPTLVKLGRDMNCGKLDMVRKIYFPAALPGIMVGIRLGASISFITVIIAEIFASDAGLGLLLQSAYALQETPRMFALVLLIFAIALLSSLALLHLERRAQSRND